jgi:syntaxin 1B/2/3
LPDILAKPEATEEDMEKDIREHEDSQKGSIFSQALLRTNEKLKQANLDYNELVKRHKEIERLNESIQSLQQLFLDLQSIVEAQENVLDSVTDHVKVTISTTENAVSDIKDAILDAKALKRVCYFFLIPNS